MAVKRGDRRDARRVELPGLMQCCIDLKPGRMENEVYINFTADVTELSAYIEEKKTRGERITFFQAYVAAIAKLMYSRPKLNRFIANRHLYEHNELTLSFVAKMSLNDRSEEIMLLIPVDKEDNMESLAQKVAAKVGNLRGDKVDKAGANSAIDVLGKLPNIIRVPVFGIMKWLDKKGRLPESLTKDNIYFSSMIISNLGSIKCGAIYHNLANFGSCSALTSIGAVRTENRVNPDGTVTSRQVCDFGVTLDERVADGYYFAKSVKLLEYILANPKLLEEPVGNIVDMGEVR